MPACSARAAAPLALLLFALLACSGGDGEGGSVTEPTDPPGGDDVEQPDPGGTLECERVGYPCALSDVSAEILRRGDSLAAQVLGMLRNGSSTAQAAAWLGAQTGIADVDADARALRFRIRFGRAHWIFLDAVAPRTSNRVSADPTAQLAASSRIVVGSGSQEKKALVLSPAQWHFGEHDDGAAVAALLAATRGYDNGVTFRANPLPSSRDVGLGSYESWEDYDVVHVGTHGTTLCDDAGCRAVIFAATLEAVLPPGPGSREDKLQTLRQRGLDTAHLSDADAEFLLLTADFFRQTYPGGLEDTIVFLNACQSSGSAASDLVNAIRGTSSVVFGWDDAVFADDARAAALALYTEFSTGGYPAEIAYERIGEARMGRPTSTGATPVLLINRRPAGGDLRLREVVELLHHISDEPLTADARIAIEGSAGDGQPDSAPWRVRVDGVRPELASTMMLHLAVDGVETAPVPLTSGAVDEMDRWTLGGSLPLGYDLEDDRAVTFRARVTLHSGGESTDEQVATLVGTEPLMGREWELTATHVSRWVGAPSTPYTATARITLGFAPGQPVDEPQPRYVITGGTVTYDYNHSYYNCTYSAPPVTFDVTPDVAGTSALVFDTRGRPVTYRGVIHTQGPDFNVDESCGDGGSVRSHRAANTWLLLDPDEALAVSDDLTTVEGSYVTRSTSTTSEFIRESNYRIVRIR